MTGLNVRWIGKILKGSSAVKCFNREMSGKEKCEYRHSGIQFIPTHQIVGSVGRAHELDNQFRFQGRQWSDRHRRIEQSIRTGKPMEPIQVLMLSRNGYEPEYFVVDGHHRVALAKRYKFNAMNADVTEVVILSATS